MTDRSTQFACLHEYLGRQRWFAGKRREFTIEAVHPLSWLSEPGTWPAVRIELVRVRHRDAASGEPTYDVYQVPMSYHREPSDALSHAHVGTWDSRPLGTQVWAYEALHDKEATPIWLAGLLARRAEPDLSFHQVGQPELVADQNSLVLQVEQSNTSVVFGDSTLLKVFRRVHHGRNPDIEIHEALTENGCDNVATLYGWIEATWPGGGDEEHRGDLAMFSDFFRTASDGWELAITSVRDLYAEGDLRADEVGGDFAGESHRLGATAATIHRDLARLLDIGSWGRDELAEVVAGMRGRLDEAARIAPALADHVPALHAAYDALAKLDQPVPVQRIHADFHLGQTMRTVGGWRVIDFEGEPARAFDDRATLDTPIRDVAGMLRSFDYAAQHLLADHDRLETLVRGAPPDDHDQLAFRAREWSERNRDAFCAGYGEVSGTDPREHATLLRAYEIDKAIYEVMYETRNRPDWLPIPMAAVERLAASMLSTES